MTNPLSRFSAACLAALLLTIAGLRAADTAAADARVQQLTASAPFKVAMQVMARDYERYVQELIMLTEIPAPPFGEKARGEAAAKLMKDAGLENVTTDPEGNVSGLYRGTGKGPLLAVAAHLDTVFPAETDVKVKRSGTRLNAPGIGDDTRNVAYMIALVRAMREAKVPTNADILFVANVGEEGPGDLRGVRYLFNKGEWKGRIKRFITIDGGNHLVVVNGGLGSKRYKVTFKGPGGHSWGAFGLVSPAFAMGNAIAKFGQLKVPTNPKVSYNVGVVSGGTSVNSIPFEVAMEVDMRAVDPGALKDVDAKFLKIIEEAVAEENAARSTREGKIVADIKLIGERPSGTTPPEHPVMQEVVAALRKFGKSPAWSTSSTDANIPISLGIPAFSMAFSAPNSSGRAHALDEWVDVNRATTVADFEIGAAVILSVANAP
ncbi:MAG: M20/M25/M40 family metallo-hydrolase [Verrucomicrobia bacterium]|nr:M20/M25/M40 family metallo-hydrolase [Verrucomicrobiota bacterium]